ncbi:flap endonuclease-1 [Salinarchaeum sp. Harcht-Bsk1]|uniref:flap endonuclease-1 n=1 Tax=Salinarchaeum sp. Harcht-Bsk1 TaxID=1333523 RepID=UPI00034232D4|nr:flap endonuclease-1 [Salinarchaeum sp. Harcht-Bsk1]AGM99997.1 flap endonuclease-1 [Salinarchaeum sp. Harcht-Bsk1]
MGNAALRELAAIEDVPIDSLAGEVVAIDAHNWLYRYLTTVVRFTRDDAYTTPNGEEVANLIGICQGVPRFLENDVTPVFVFDGAVTDLKADEVEQRREARAVREEQLERAREEGDAMEVARLESQTQRLTDTIQSTSRELLERLDLPVVEAPAEGEAQCAHMAADGTVDAAGTEDYDALLFGSPVTYRDLTSSGDVERMELQATLDRHGITYEQLVDAGILCGTDFNDGVHGVGPKTAIDAIQEHGDLFGVLDARGEELPHADRIRNLFFDPPVTDDYDIDLTVTPDLDAAREFVVDGWGVASDEVDRGFERIRDATQQTGLDRWS